MNEYKSKSLKNSGGFVFRITRQTILLLTNYKYLKQYTCETNKRLANLNEQKFTLYVFTRQKSKLKSKCLLFWCLPSISFLALHFISVHCISFLALFFDKIEHLLAAPIGKTKNLSCISSLYIHVYIMLRKRQRRCENFEGPQYSFLLMETFKHQYKKYSVDPKSCQ